MLNTINPMLLYARNMGWERRSLGLALD